MRGDPDAGFAAHNFYGRLNQLLGLPGKDAPPGFARITGFWRDLATWLDRDNAGARDSSTAVPLRGFTHIGYPISQSLLRAGDRRHLPEFFAQAGINPGDEIDPEDLAGPFTQWTRQSACPLSAWAKTLIVGSKNQQARQVVYEIVAREARNWTGETRHEEGTRSAPIALRIEPVRGGQSFELLLYPRRPRGFPSGQFRWSGGSVELVPLDDEAEWYDAIPLDPREVLRSGVVLRSGKIELGWSPQPVVVAKQDVHVLGGYVSQPRAVLGERLLILARKDLTWLVERVLQESAAAGWRRAPSTTGLPEGWTAYLDVTLERRPTVFHPDLACLSPGQRVPITLEGGLKLGPTAWLSGAEPRLRVALDDAEPVEITIDGVLASRHEGGAATVDLAALGLDPGEHQILVNGRARVLQTYRSGDYQPLAARRRERLGHVLRRSGARYEATYPSPTRVVEGAVPAAEIIVIGPLLRGHHEDLPEQLPEPLTLQGGARRYILLGPRPGMAWWCTDPSRPPFRYFRQRPSAPPFAVTPPFQPVWLVRVSESHHTSVRRVGSATPPANQPWPGGDLAEWTRLLRKKHRRGPTGADAALWRQYADMARRL